MPTAKPARRARAKHPRQRVGARDGGQMLVLGGVVLCMAYLLATASGMEVTRLEHEALADEGMEQHIVAWRELRAEFARIAGTHVSPRALLTSVEEVSVPRVAHEWRVLADARRYDAALVLLPDEEAVSHPQGAYAVWNHDRSDFFDAPFDGTDDGIVWETPCPRPRGGAGGCATGFFLQISIMTTERLDIHERILIRLTP